MDNRLSLKTFVSSALQEIAADLVNKSSELCLDLAPCGKIHINSLLTTVVEASLALPVSEDHANTPRNLTDMSYDNMRTAKDCASLAWRRLYSDTSLIWSLMDSCVNQSNVAAFEEAIARLDRAIIVAGAPGEGRLDLILDLIELIQRAYLPLSGMPSQNICTESCFRSDIKSHNTPVASSSKAIPSLPRAPTLSAFQSKHCHRPFILRGFAGDWPALSEHNWTSKDYLLDVAGRGRLVPVEIGSDYRTDDWKQTIMRWEDFLNYLLPMDSRPPSQEVIYLAQHDLFKQFPALRRDIVVPDYVYSALQPPKSYLKYRPPSNPDELVVNVWFGPKGTESPAHTDPYYNLYVQVAGHKTVWIAPPHVSHAMSPYGAGTHATDQQEGVHHPATNQDEPFMSNTSRIDVFASSTQPLATKCCLESFAEGRQEAGLRADDSVSGDDNISTKNRFIADDRFREKSSADDVRFQEIVIPEAMSATLGPGDMLFFPPGWWHAMRSESVSLSVSMWF